jgi:hypothetical protein
MYTIMHSHVRCRMAQQQAMLVKTRSCLRTDFRTKSLVSYRSYIYMPHYFHLATLLHFRRSKLDTITLL